MKVRYTGPHDEVEIREFELTVQRNHQLDIPDAIGARLVEQDGWEEVGAPKPKAPASASSESDQASG